MRDDELSDGGEGTGEKPADDRVELGRWHDSDGRLIKIIHEEVPIVEVTEYVIEPDREEAGPEEGKRGSPH